MEPAMTTGHLTSYRDRLGKIVQRAQRDATTVSEQAFGPGGDQGAGGLSNAPLHLGDLGTEAYLQELNATLLENQEYLVKEALAAMRRVDDGTFGRCENCRQPIIRARLDAIPFTRFCAACAEILRPGPQVNLNSGRPHSPDETAALGQGGVDRHAAGNAGGGTAAGGLAGSNFGRGDPRPAELESAAGSGQSDAEDQDEEGEETPLAGRAGGAVGGTPAGKRAGRPTSSKSKRWRG
jgi:RNA polymerase-binding transcription factor DksA